MSELIDNRAQRVRALKEITERLHRGETPETVKGALREIVRQTDYGEIVAMEEQLMAEGIPVSEVQSMCDLHSQVTREVLVAAPPRQVAPGHPVDTMRRENQALRGALLAQYPGIEEELIRVAPAFAKLRNPVLRRTVAKVATLKQAARVGGISLRERMAHLRRITGEAWVGGEGAESEAEARPAWVSEGRVAEDIDADAMLAHGVHPVGRVREACGFLGDGEMLRLRSSFRPVPLLELMRRNGLAVYCEEEAPGWYVSYFGRWVTG